MIRHRDLNELIAQKIGDAEGRRGDIVEIIACLAAGIGLAVAVSTEGDGRLANAMCEAASAGIFESATSDAKLVAIARGRA